MVSNNDIGSRGTGVKDEEFYFNQIATLFEQIAQITTDMKNDISVLKDRGTDYEKGIIMTNVWWRNDCSANNYLHQLQAAVATNGLLNSVPDLTDLTNELANPTDIEQDIVDWANGTYTGDS